MTEILLADDHAVVLEGLRVLIERESDMRVAGETVSGLEVEGLVARLRPDLVVLNLVMPEINGLEITRLLRTNHPRTRVVVLSSHANSAYAANAFHHGAGGYILKRSTTAQLVEAIRVVAAGGRYLSPPLSEEDVEKHSAQIPDTRLDLYEKLTRRERQVLGLAAHGLKCCEIGVRLAISSRTVEVHRANVMRKLGLRTQVELYRYALSRRIVVGPVSPAETGAICRDRTCEECRQQVLDSCRKLLASAENTKQVCQLSLEFVLPCKSRR